MTRGVSGVIRNGGFAELVGHLYQRPHAFPISWGFLAIWGLRDLLRQERPLAVGIPSVNLLSNSMKYSSVEFRRYTVRPHVIAHQTKAKCQPGRRPHAAA
jgi:hypothetical protein